MAEPFDVRCGETTGDAFPVVDQIAQDAAIGAVASSVSGNGILAFREGSSGGSAQLTWFDRDGKQLGIISAPGINQNPTLSPDGQRLAVARNDIWLIDLLRGTDSRFTFEGGGAFAWSPDGKMIAFSATRKGQPGIYQKAASGAGNEELLIAGTIPWFVGDWSSDGRFIIFRKDNNDLDIWALPTFGDRKPFPVLQTKFNENDDRLSPDGRWIACNSDESGRREIYVQNFPPSGGKWQVSVQGGISPSGGATARS